MITQFRGQKPIVYIITIAPWVTKDYFVAREDDKEKSCIINLQSFDKMQEILEAVKNFMETNYFRKEEQVVSLSEIMKA